MRLGIGQWIISIEPIECAKNALLVFHRNPLRTFALGVFNNNLTSTTKF